MEAKTIQFRGHDIRIDPDGNINVTDVAQALGLSRQQWYMLRTREADKFESHIGKYRFDKRGVASTTLDREGIMAYLEMTEQSVPDAVKLRNALRAYYSNETPPAQYQKLECENVLASVQAFLNKLPNVPADLAEEFVEVRKKIQAIL